MQYSLDSQRRAHTARFLGPKIITTYETMPKPSLSGGIVSHYYLNGIHARARVIGVSKLGRKGLIVDTQEERSEHERRDITAAVLKGFGEQDIFTEHLSQVAAPEQLIPPAAHFTNIRAASPFFRTDELKIFHKDLTESPWTEESFLPIQEESLLIEQEIREGSFVRLYDPALAHETQGNDSPQLFGQVHHFIGYTPIYAVALLNILTFYRFGNLMSYSTGEIIHPSLRLREQTIILIARPRCRFEQEPTLAFKPKDVDIEHSFTFFHAIGMVAWGPKRDWPNRADWEKELRKTVEEGDRESRRRVWGREEADGRQEERG